MLSNYFLRLNEKLNEAIEDLSLLAASKDEESLKNSLGVIKGARVDKGDRVRSSKEAVEYHTSHPTESFIIDKVHDVFLGE